MKTVLEVKGLEKSYGKFKVVKGISFSIKEGEIFGLLGPNGAGKSTTINMITGVLAKDSGSIKILGKTLEEDWEFVKNNMNVSSAYFNLSGILTINQNLTVYAKLYNVKNIQAKIDRLLEDFELMSHKNKLAENLSSGQRTRLNLCKGLINEPKLLLLDEATIGLDPDIAEKTRRLILEYQKRTNCSILFTSHYMGEIEQMCDRIAFLGDGKIIKVDTVANLKKMIKKQQVEIDFIKSNKKLKELFLEKDINIIIEDDNRIIFEIDAHGDKLYRLMSSLFKRGHFVRNMHIKRPTLDDIFIKIARKK